MVGVDGGGREPVHREVSGAGGSVGRVNCQVSTCPS